MQEIKGRYILPTFTERTSYGFKELSPYTKLFEERIIFLGAPIDDTSANDVMAQLLCLESMDPDRDIFVYINSPGGSFTALTAIYDTMQFIRPDIQTVCMGQAASAAAVLLAAGTRGKRFALPNSRIMVHQPSGGAQGQATDIEIQAREILKLRQRLNEIYVKHTAQPIEAIERKLERDTYMSAEEARDFGLIDQVVEQRPPIPGAEAPKS
jgi:ATP-dependent Clp protease protease subunit